MVALAPFHLFDLIFKSFASPKHGIATSIFQIFNCPIEVVAIPALTSVHVDGLRQLSMIDKVAKLRRAEAEVCRSAIFGHQPWRVGA
jgi:hypothetical protein